ncbi:MAG: PaaI family thioesterase [Gammaproteobacteria bacterium]|nr:PaaI family thioesterase [Gammaproteobacteria bacterium]
MSKQLTVEDFQEMISKSRFHQLFQPQVLSVNYDELRLVIKMKMSDALERQPGTNQWHGGAISAVVDTVGCYGLAMLAVEPLPTINFRTDYLRPAINTDITAMARIRTSGKSIAVVDVDIDNDKGQLIAVGRACYSTRSSQIDRQH